MHLDLSSRAECNHRHRRHVARTEPMDPQNPALPGIDRCWMILTCSIP